MNNRESANLYEFAGTTSHYNPKCWNCTSISHSQQRKPRPHVENSCANKNKLKYPCVAKLYPQHIPNMIYSFKCHRREIEKLCHTKSKDPSYKFNKLIRHLNKKDPGFSTYKRSIIDFFMKNFNRMNQHDLISILWLLCHLHFSKLISLPNNRNIRHRHITVTYQLLT